MSPKPYLFRLRNTSTPDKWVVWHPNLTSFHFFPTWEQAMEWLELYMTGCAPQYPSGMLP